MVAVVCVCAHVCVRSIKSCSKSDAVDPVKLELQNRFQKHHIFETGVFFEPSDKYLNKEVKFILICSIFCSILLFC